MILLKMIVVGAFLAITIGLSGSRWFALPEIQLERCLKMVEAAHRDSLALRVAIKDRAMRAEVEKFYRQQYEADLLKICGVDENGPQNFISFERQD
jgi:hypothetical protein